MINLIDTPDRKLELINAEVGRVIQVGTDWTKLRIGFRATWTDVPVNPGICPFYVGVMSNPSASMANGPLKSATSHFVGVWNSTTGLTRNAGPPVHYTGLSFFTGFKVGSTWTGGSGSALRLLSDGRRGAHIVDITKATNYSIDLMGPHPSNPIANPGTDITYEVLLGAMEAGNAINSCATFLNSFAGTGAYVSTGNTQSGINEGTNGPLNAVCVSWGRSYPSCRISEIVWSKLA